MLTIQQILDSSDFSYLSLLNSPADLNREIHAIDTTETPDVADFLPKHTFLLTTGMAFQDNPEKFCAFISSLDELPIAGIGIKLGRYLDEIDPMVIKHANQLNFPLIQIPKEQTLWAVSQQLVSYLWESQAGEMQMALNIQRQFSEVILKGSTIDNFIKYLGSILNLPIVLQDPFFHVLSTSQHYKTSRHTIEQFNKDQEFLFGDGDCPFIDSLSKQDFETDGYYIHPIKVDPLITYYLTFKKKEKQAFPLSSLMLEQISFVLSHAIFKELKFREEQINAKKPFFNRLLQIGDNSSDYSIDWFEYGKDFGFTRSNYYRIGIFHFYSDAIPFINQETKQLRLTILYRWLEKEAAKFNKSIILFPLDNLDSFGILFQSNVESFEEKLGKINTVFQKITPFRFQFHVGNPVLSVHDIHYSYKEAAEIAESVEEIPTDAFIVYYETKKTQDLFHNIPDHVKRDFCLATLKDLAYPEDESMEELRHTLKVYLDTQCNIQLSSEQLFIHRNTVIYRINKCKKLLGITLEDPQETLNLRVAFEMSERNLAK